MNICHDTSQPTLLDECQLEESVKELLLANIRRRLMPQALKVRAEIELGCYSYEGVDAVKDALRSGIACGTEDMPIKINLIAPPKYVVTTTTLEKAEGIELLEGALAKIKESISKFSHIFNITTAVIHPHCSVLPYHHPTNLLSN